MDTIKKATESLLPAKHNTETNEPVYGIDVSFKSKCNVKWWPRL